MSEKWWDMSDDELDDLFRDASDKVEIPFESSSLNKLRQKIDIRRKPEPPQGYKNGWLVLLAGLFLIVGVGLVYHSVSKKQSSLIDPNGNKSTEIIGNVQQEYTVLPSHSPVLFEIKRKEGVKNEVTPLKPENLSNNLANSSGQKEQVIEKSQSSASVSPRVAEKDHLGKPSVHIPAKTGETMMADSQLSRIGNTGKYGQAKADHTLERVGSVNHEEKTAIAINSSSREAASMNNRVINQVQSKKGKRIYPNVDNEAIGVENLVNNKALKGKTSNSLTLAQNTSPIIENPIIVSEKTASEEVVDRTDFYDVNALKSKDSKSLLTKILIDLPPYIDSLPKEIKSPKLRHFGIRLGFSPDINSIEKLEYSLTGGSVDLLFEYSISKKFALQTGVSYSSKKYAGDFEYYHAWPDWTKGHPSKPTEVDGMCKVIDIPINLRFNIFQKSRQTWFVSSGVSSYIILNETYIYNYTWSPTKTSNWSDNSSFYWSTLNLSVGWEKQISKHLSFQAEPYLKTPLKGVGRGLVNLYSSGILFSTKYQF